MVGIKGAPQPYLAESLPQLNTGSWRVAPDGQMETTYKPRPNLTWHDGAPLTAEDFVFSWRAYATPQFGHASSPPDSLMEEVSAPDPLTLVIQWKASFPDANRLMREYSPLPRHILEEPFRQATESGQLDQFVNHPYWNTEYVGAGPFRVDRWEPGTYIDGSAFDSHVLGRPKIDRIRLQFMSDANAVLASLMAGDLHLSIDDSIRFQQGVVLRRDWAARGSGALVINPTQWRYTYAQLNAELARPRGLTDVRVRRALAHTIDRQGLNEGLFEGEGMMTDTMIAPTVPYFEDVPGFSLYFGLAVLAHDAALRGPGEVVPETDVSQGRPSLGMALSRLRRIGARGLKPGVLVGGVVDHKIDDDADAEARRAMRSLSRCL